jgi:GNAT superfamily N-acetyltransferase
MGDLFVAERFRGRSVGGTLMEAVANPHNDVARSMYERAGYEESGLGVFEDGCFYWDEAGECQWDGEPHRYLVKDLDKG